ncbi:LamG-like jellyroll fold domain-containing protein [Spirosoma luteolum]
MTRSYATAVNGWLLLLLGVSLWACSNWELPLRKTQRTCLKPNGTLDALIQQRKVDFTISNTSGTIDKIAWDFGNGTTLVTTATTTPHTYSASGTYTVKALLTNDCGVETTLVRTVTVSDAVLPGVALQPPTGITLSSAKFVLTLTSTGNAAITKYGICYSTSNPLPELGKDPQLDAGVPAVLNAPVSLTLGSLPANTFFYVRAYVTNQTGTAYSSPTQAFRTNANPIVAINPASTVGTSTATVGFILTSPGSPAAVEYGICYSATTNAPDVGNATLVTVSNPTIGANTVVNLSGLMANTRYYYRSYARLATGDVLYSNTIESFSTLVDTVSQGLVASLSFTDGSLLDVSGNNNHATPVGSPTFTTDHRGRPSSALLLDGANDFIYLSESPSLRPNDLTISLWIKPAAVPRIMQIYNKSRYSDGAFEMYSSLIKPTENDPGGITINTDIKQGSNCVAGRGWQTFPFGARIPVNTWHHLVFAYSGRSVRMYFDNRLLYSKDDLPATEIDQCPGGDLKFGAQYQALPNFFNGALDDIRVYNRALNTDEVNTLYNQ